MKAKSNKQSPAPSAQATGAEKPEQSTPEAVAEAAIEQATTLATIPAPAPAPSIPAPSEAVEVTTEAPPPVAISLCDGGRFKVSTLASVLADCKSAEARTPTLPGEKHRTTGKARKTVAEYDWSAIPARRLPLTKAEIAVKRAADSLGDALAKLGRERAAYKQSE